jgi:calcium/calmodulin-dependent protein kinase I
MNKESLEKRKDHWNLYEARMNDKVLYYEKIDEKKDSIKKSIYRKSDNELVFVGAMNKNKITNKNFLEDYDLLETIGKGSFAIIRRAFRKSDNEEVAIKIIDKTHLVELVKGSILNECKLLTELDHPGIVKVYAYGEDSVNYYCAMRYYGGGNLHDALVEYKSFRERTAFHVLDQLLDALEYMHNKNIIHRDIKLENIFVSDPREMGVVLGDLGFSTFQRIGGPKLKDYPGSPEFSSPELMDNIPYEGRKSDIWAIGVCFFLIVTGNYPFLEDDSNTLFERIAYGNPVFPKNTFLTSSCNNFVLWMLEKNPKNRPDISEIRSHECFVSMKERYENPSYYSSNSGSEISSENYSEEEEPVVRRKYNGSSEDEEYFRSLINPRRRPRGEEEEEEEGSSD